jgi:hypothetical protein
MNGIQVLLTTGVVLLLLYYILRIRSAVFDLVIVFLFAACAVFFILFPQYTNVVAAKLGVGRGTDLLFYSCVVFFSFVVIKLFARIRRLENMLTVFVREQAKENFHFGKRSEE